MPDLLDMIDDIEIEVKTDEKPVTKTEKKPAKKPKRIVGDKEFKKKQMSNYLAKYILENQDNFTLDWLRGQKLTYECVNEMRKQTKKKVKK